MYRIIKRGAHSGNMHKYHAFQDSCISLSTLTHNSLTYMTLFLMYSIIPGSLVPIHRFAGEDITYFQQMLEIMGRGYVGVVLHGKTLFHTKGRGLGHSHRASCCPGI